MMQCARGVALAAALAAGWSSVGAAQDAPKAGAVAPAFALAGATRHGVLPAPVRLADFKGQTVVLAFFYKARTKG
jgi:peroxiredoxin Q/BCP